jgi:hypothetical protein
MPDDMMRLWREQTEAWMKLMNPTAAPQSLADAQRAWEGFFQQQLDLWQRAGEATRAQLDQVLRPFQQQMEATMAATQEMQRLGRWFSEEAAGAFKAMRDYYTLLAEIEERLAQLHRMTAEQVERMQAAMPRSPWDGPAGGA